MTTKIVSITDLRRDTSRIVRAAQEEGDVVYITRYDRPVAVILDHERYEALLTQLEDLSDIVAIQEAASEPRRRYEEFIVEVGLTEAPAAE